MQGVNSALLKFSKKENDKRNTYIELTEEGDQLLLELVKVFDSSKNSVYLGAQPLKDLYGKFPDMMEMMAIVKNIYGDDFMNIFEKSFANIVKKSDRTNFFQKNIINENTATSATIA